MIGEKLKGLRKTKGLTISDSAQIFGIATRTYSSYESEEREPNITMINKLADFYGVSVDYLFGREPKPPEPNPFADLNLSEEDEAEVVAKYMSMPPEVRAIMLDVLLQLADAARNKPNETEKRSEHQ